MLKFHLVSWSERKAYEELLESHFRLRHEIYVIDRRWRKLDRPIPLEIDEFDNSDAFYLLGVDDSGGLAGGSRLIPTTSPHLLSDIFPMLADGAPPRHANTFEWSRYFIAPRLRRKGEAAPEAGMVQCALLEACMRLGVTQLTVVCEAFWQERLDHLGWRYSVLGPTLDHPDGSIIALLIDVGEDVLARTRAAYGFGSTSFLQAGADSDHDSTTEEPKKEGRAGPVQDAMAQPAAVSSVPVLGGDGGRGLACA